MKVFFPIIAGSLFLFGCSGASFNTNLDSVARQQYKVIAVQEYSFQQMNTFQAESLGAVSANYCQEEIDDPNPSRHAVIDGLKAKVYERGGNGLVVEQCVSSRYRTCESYIECRGVAYQVPEN